MVSKKKPVSKKARSRVSLVSRSLAGEVRSNGAPLPLEEPWRSRKPKGQHGSNRKK
jgi:hypothetical protein